MDNNNTTPDEQPTIIMEWVATVVIHAQDVEVGRVNGCAQLVGDIVMNALKHAAHYFPDVLPFNVSHPTLFVEVGGEPRQVVQENPGYISQN